MTSIFTFKANAEGFFVFNNTLRLGMTSPDVMELQKFLNINGFPVSLIGGGSQGNETKYFGQKTKAAVILFQKAKGLIGDGIVGFKTRQYLNNTPPIIPPSTLPVINTPFVPVPAVIAPVVTPTRSSSVTGGGGSTSRTIKISTISDIAVPVADGTPTSSIPSTNEWTATISWNGNPTVFTGNTAYTATIVIYPKANYTLNGIPDNFFNVSGAITTNIASRGVVTAVFPSTPQKQLTISSPTITTEKVYDGDDITSVTPGTLSGKITGDTVTVSAVATYDTKDVGTEKTITVVYTLGGADASKYIKPINYSASTGVITVKDITVTATSSQAKIYGTSDPVFTYTAPGLVEGDSLTGTLTRATGENVGDYAITIGTLADTNYNITFESEDFSINEKQLIISSPTITTTKIYNGNDTAVVTPGTLSGIVSSDDVTIDATTATYDTKHVGTNKTITVSYTITGAKASNYIEPIDSSVSNGVITSIQLTISNPTLTTSKEYDRTTYAVVTPGSLTGVVDGGVTVSATATYDSPNIGTNKTITVVYTLAGANSEDYIKPIDYVVYSGVITQKQLTIASQSLTTTKVYDGNTTAVISAVTLSGVATGEEVTVSAVSTYDNSSSGTGKTITTVYTIGGASAANYIKPVDNINTDGVIQAVIDTAVIAGVTAPVTGATPVSSLADGTGYSATISWSPSASTFAPSTAYNATVTLTAKAGYTLTGVGTNFFTVAGATATNTANTGVVSAVFPQTQSYATVPSSITLAVGSTAPVGAVTNVAIPASGATDTTGVITGYVATSADKIKFTVTDNGGTSTITINGSAYTSGADYQIIPTTSFPTIVVTTTQSNRTTSVRTFIVTGPFVNTDGLTYGIVIGADGKKWLDRNLGANRVATAYNDVQSYGYSFQWGRANDGHQKTANSYTNGVSDSNSTTTSTLSSADTVSAPDTAKFIMSPSTPYDWRSPQSPNQTTLWAGANGGTNNVCPAGFHVPTSAEWGTWVTALGGFTTATCGGTSTCREIAFNSSLKIPVAGLRNYSDGSLNYQGSNGYCWSSSVSGTIASHLYFTATTVNPATADYRAYGFTVRCLKD
jgi:uncharacterized protein (TIGR02145 family)